MSAERKKGIGALGWILIGCLGVLILGAVLTFACTAFVAKKVKDVGEEFADNPAMAAAEVLVKVNPELELLERDDENQTLTIRNKETGETMTFDLEEIQSGKFSAKFGDKEIVVDPESDEGLIQIGGGPGGETVTFGQGDLDAVPDWLPIYPDSDAQAPMQMASGEGVTGTVTMQTDDSVDDVIAFYSERLDNAGFELESSTHSAGNQMTSTLRGTREGATVNLVVSNEDNTTQISATYQSS